LLSVIDHVVAEIAFDSSTGVLLFVDQPPPTAAPVGQVAVATAPLLTTAPAT
jgi:hypothetical protein